jgi:hypothetical protein
MAAVHGRQFRFRLLWALENTTRTRLTSYVHGVVGVCECGFVHSVEGYTGVYIEKSMFEGGRVCGCGCGRVAINAGHHPSQSRVGGWMDVMHHTHLRTPKAYEINRRVKG